MLIWQNYLARAFGSYSAKNQQRRAGASPAPYCGNAVLGLVPTFAPRWPPLSARLTLVF
jgi:hypothetical protein